MTVPKNRGSGSIRDSPKPCRRVIHGPRGARLHIQTLKNTIALLAHHYSAPSTKNAQSASLPATAPVAPPTDVLLSLRVLPAPSQHPPRPLQSRPEAPVPFEALFTGTTTHWNAIGQQCFGWFGLLATSAPGPCQKHTLVGPAPPYLTGLINRRWEARGDPVGRG